jgi:hypothetical protein
MKIKTLLVLVVMFSVIACKNDNVMSKIDPNAQDVPVVSEDQLNPEANIGPAPTAEVKAPAVTNGQYPVMQFESSAHDFGKINAGDKVSYDFKFTNTGTGDLVIANAVGSCGCTVPEYPKEPLAPGKSGVMKVTFNSAGKSGMQQKTVTITTNTKAQKEQLTIKAAITPQSGVLGH